MGAGAGDGAAEPDMPHRGSKPEDGMSRGHGRDGGKDGTEAPNAGVNEPFVKDCRDRIKREFLGKRTQAEAW